MTTKPYGRSIVPAWRRDGIDPSSSMMVGRMWCGSRLHRRQKRGRAWMMSDKWNSRSDCKGCQREAGPLAIMIGGDTYFRKLLSIQVLD